MPKALIFCVFLLVASYAQAQDQIPPSPQTLKTTDVKTGGLGSAETVTGSSTNAPILSPLRISATSSNRFGEGPYLRVISATIGRPVQNTIADLRPLLKVETKTTRMRGQVARRVCDLASIQIKLLLGDPFLPEDFAPESCTGEYGLSDEALALRDAQWKVWDKKIEDIEQRLDSLDHP